LLDSNKKLQERYDKLREEVEEEFKIKTKSIHEKFYEQSKEIESAVRQIMPDEREVSIYVVIMSKYNLLIIY